MLNYVTAYQMLQRSAQVKKGQRAVIHGAAGGVGSALLQLGRIAGLETYGTCSARGASAVRDLGAVPIDYQHQDFVKEIHRLTGEGVDVVFDPIGGTHLWRSRKAVRAGGKVVGYGLATSLRGEGLTSTRPGRRQRFRGTALFGLYIAGGWLLPGRKRVVPYSIQPLKRLKPEWFRQDQVETDIQERIRTEIELAAENSIIINQEYLDDEQLTRERQFEVLTEIFNMNVRNEEIRAISHHFSPVFRNGHPIHLSVLGKTGTGKTISLLWFLAQIQLFCEQRGIPFRQIHLDLCCPAPCFRALNTLACMFGASKYYKKGISLEELMSRIELSLQPAKGYVVIIVDEADKDIPHRRHRAEAPGKAFRDDHVLHRVSPPSPE